MPFFDRHWRLRWLGVGFAAAAAVLFPLLYLHAAAVWDHRRGWDMWPDELFAGGSFVVLVGVAILLAWSAGRAHERLQWRLEQLAEVHPTRGRAASRGTEAPADAPAERLTIVQPIGVLDRIIGWLAMPMFIGITLILLWTPISELQVLGNPDALDFRTVMTRVFGYLPLLPVLAFGLWLLGSWASNAWIPSVRFELDELGITSKRSRGRSLTIRWQDARLLERAAYYYPDSNHIARKVYYLLYGDDGTVIHIDSSRIKLRPMLQLLDLVEKHTGLVPRQIIQLGFREYIGRLVRRPFCRG